MAVVHNFGAGPAKLPAEVYERLRAELADFEGTGISLLETSHRDVAYGRLNAHAQLLVRRLLNVPDNYRILFMPGGGQGQFAAVPLNLMGRTGSADYVVTGFWSKKAALEAEKYGKVKLVLPSCDQHRDIPPPAAWQLDPAASYVHICANETVHGVEFDWVPDTRGVPLVADMSSNIMTRCIDISKFGVIYAGAQKNIGTAGVALVIVRDDLLGGALPVAPSVLDWTLTDRADSVLNTPPMYAVRVMELVLEWVERSGGVAEMEARAVRKSAALYSAIEESGGFYRAPVAVAARSRMNVPFRVGAGGGNEALEREFVAGAEARGLIQLKGHRAVGGVRASLYNAVAEEEVSLLVQYMRDFRLERA